MAALPPDNTAVFSNLRKVDSSLTLTSSNWPTPQRSRASSIDSTKRAKMESETMSLRSSRNFISQELAASWMSVVIIICFFTSGLIDSVAFNSWNCFVGMQTGNTIFAALGIGGQPEASHKEQYFKSLVSIGSFCLGTLFFNALHRYPTGLSQQPSSRRRAVFITSFAIQTVLIVIAATVVSLHLVSNQPFVAGTFSSGNDNVQDEDELTDTNYLDLCPIALLAFGAAGQVCLSRVLSIIELPTIVLSTLYHDFTADLYGLTSSWRETSLVVPEDIRSRTLSRIRDLIFVKQKRQIKRLSSIIALFLGGIVGGELYKTSIAMGGALYIAAALKGLITISFLFWKRDPNFDDDEKHTGDGAILPK